MRSRGNNAVGLINGENRSVEKAQQQPSGDEPIPHGKTTAGPLSEKRV